MSYSFRDSALSWTFHRNTSRWAHNAMESQDTDDIPEPGSEHPLRDYIDLPEPTKIGETLENLVQRRCSCRDFSDDMISLGELSTVLSYGYGVLGEDRWGGAEFLERPVPSGGGMYPLELSVLSRNVNGLADGVYHYVPLLNALECVRDVRIPDPLLRYLFMGQYPVLKASAIILISAVPGRSMKKYSDRGYRYILLEAGHVAQNINLTCPGVGIDSLNLGGFFDDEIANLFGFDRDTEVPVYAVCLGKGADSSKHALRFSEDQL